LFSDPKLAIFFLALADLVGNKAYRSDMTQMENHGVRSLIYGNLPRLF
jgi:hypothetical protein